MRSLIVVLLVLALSGCTAPGMPGHVGTSTSDFDGSKEVSLQPANVTAEGSLTVPFNLGAHWSSKDPKTVWLIVSVPGVSSGGYVSIQSKNGLQFNIDGDVVKRDSPDVATDFEGDVIQGVTYQESAKSFPVDISLVRRIVSADLTKAKLVTGEGYLEGRLTNGPNSALDGLKRFLARVEQIKE